MEDKNTRQFLLMANGDLVDDKPLGITHTNWSETIPYWVSCPVGATLEKVKVMGLRVTTGPTGGSASIKIYTMDVDKKRNIFITKDTPLEPDCELVEVVDMTAPGEFVNNYVTKYKHSDYKFNSEKLMFAIIDLAGDIMVEDVYVWIDYHNNEII